jgi:hypothetical protein
VLDQQFQVVTGSLGGQAISEGRLRGEEITFNVGNARYTGKVNGNRDEGSIAGGSGGAWTATRASK